MSLPALCVDTSTGDLAPPPPPEEVDLSVQWTRTSPVSIPARPRSRTPSPCHLMVEQEPFYTRHPQATPPAHSPTTRLAPPPSTYPIRNWSCLNPDQPDVDSPNPSLGSPFYSPLDSPSNAPLASRPGQTSPAPPSRDYRATLPVERWAENVNRYYGSQSAAGGGAAPRGGGGAAPGEELSELETLYQASLLAPSMHRGNRGVSPQPAATKPGENRDSTHFGMEHRNCQNLK